MNYKVIVVILDQDRTENKQVITFSKAYKWHHCHVSLGIKRDTRPREDVDDLEPRGLEGM